MDVSKSVAILYIFEQLNKGESINKVEIAKMFNKTEKTIQRYINEIRDYYSEIWTGKKLDIRYSQENNGHILVKENDDWLKKDEILSICKVLLESRAFSKQEMKKLIDKLIKQTSPQNRKIINELLLNELYHYIPVRHNQELIKKIWEINNAVRKSKIIHIEYKKVKNRKLVKRDLEPLGIIFDEYYFYMIAHFKNQKDNFKIPYRLDRIKKYKVKNENFKVPYKDRFEEGKFRKRIQFMNPGKLIKVKFKFWGRSIEAILDRLPTAKIIDRINDVYYIETKVYGDGVKMWFLSQAQYLKILKPNHFRKEIKETINQMADIY